MTDTSANHRSPVEATGSFDPPPPIATKDHGRAARHSLWQDESGGPENVAPNNDGTKMFIIASALVAEPVVAFRELDEVYLRYRDDPEADSSPEKPFMLTAKRNRPRVRDEVYDWMDSKSLDDVQLRLTIIDKVNPPAWWTSGLPRPQGFRLAHEAHWQDYASELVPHGGAHATIHLAQVSNAIDLAVRETVNDAFRGRPHEPVAVDALADHRCCIADYAAWGLRRRLLGYTTGGRKDRTPAFLHLVEKAIIHDADGARLLALK